MISFFFRILQLFVYFLFVGLSRDRLLLFVCAFCFIINRIFIATLITYAAQSGKWDWVLLADWEFGASISCRLGQAGAFTIYQKYIIKVSIALGLVFVFHFTLFVVCTFLLFGVSGSPGRSFIIN